MTLRQFVVDKTAASSSVTGSVKPVLKKQEEKHNIPMHSADGIEVLWLKNGISLDLMATLKTCETNKYIISQHGAVT